MLSEMDFWCHTPGLSQSPLGSALEHGPLSLRPGAPPGKQLSVTALSPAPRWPDKVPRGRNLSLASCSVWGGWAQPQSVGCNYELSPPQGSVAATGRLCIACRAAVSEPAECQPPRGPPPISILGTLQWSSLPSPTGKGRFPGSKAKGSWTTGLRRQRGLGPGRGLPQASEALSPHTRAPSVSAVAVVMTSYCTGPGRPLLLDTILTAMTGRGTETQSAPSFVCGEDNIRPPAVLTEKLGTCTPGLRLN